MKAIYLITLQLFIVFTSWSQSVPPASESRLYDIVNSVSAERIEKDIKKLVGFGTRNTLSDTVSATRGIGAARRWIKGEFESISKECNSCLTVTEQRTLVKGDDKTRIKQDTWVVNIIAIQKSSKQSNRYIIMSGDIDSRASSSTDAETDAPGANDNASGMAGVIEASRVLSQYNFEANIVYVGLSGEEQGLFGGKHLAQKAKKEGWEIIGVLNNDMIGNIEGVDGVIANNSFRIFSEPTPVTEDDDARRKRRFYGGEVDGVSRQLARYVAKLTDQYIPNLDPMLIYRLDRFGRGGHHRPFNDMGFAGIRIMETHENYTRQHQDIRTENGINYGDVIEGVNFEYAAKLTVVNAITMASLAWAPPAPKGVLIGGAVQPSTSLAWDKTDNKNIAGYKIYWRATTAPQWEHHKFVGNTENYTLEGLVIDNYLFGVAAVGKDGNESVVVFPSGLIPRNR
ncbi:MAG: peptidase M28 [Bacteroidetes bacterium]|nr:MAG: peptidase M28 [Bacteroidota bacterium]